MKVNLVLDGPMGELIELGQAVKSSFPISNCIIARSAPIFEGLQELLKYEPPNTSLHQIPIIIGYEDKQEIPVALETLWQLHLSPTQTLPKSTEILRYLEDRLNGVNHREIGEWYTPVYSLWDDALLPVWRTDGLFRTGLTKLFSRAKPDPTTKGTALLNLSIVDTLCNTRKKRVDYFTQVHIEKEEDTAILVGHPVHPHLLDSRVQVQSYCKDTSATLVTCVKNEEAKLPGFLTRYVPFFHYVVLVDNGSTDKTVEIAKECGAIVVNGKDIQSFARLRNVGLKEAHKLPTPWLVHIDVDEEIVDLQPLARCLHDDFVEALSVTIKAPSAGLVGQAVRIFRNTEAIKYVGMVHEEIVGFKFYREVPEIEWFHTKVFDETKERHYWGLLIEDLRRNPKEYRVWYNVGKTLRSCGAMEISTLAFTMAKQLNPQAYMPRIALAESALCVASKMLDEVGELVGGFVRNQEIVTAHTCLQTIVGGVDFPLPKDIVEKDLASISKLAEEVLRGKSTLILPGGR